MALLAGCGSGRASVPFSLYTGSLALPELTTRFRSTEDAVRGMAGILTVGLGLPLPERVASSSIPGAWLSSAGSSWMPASTRHGRRS